ncbi:hypothetical protein B9479_006823 [Cryptococcus floricola]|uniref:Uncharacterized protein n=1 Tax=Cryptococcus floricola TaxID=2591691 RepID=A0A5D3AR22_9TREE|nr:hypothetical protein B9479_006823 [Cryptococcus floricola]
MSDNRSTRSSSPLPDPGPEDRLEEVVCDWVLANDVPGSTATAGGPSQEHLENPFHQLPEGSDEENEEQELERVSEVPEFWDGIRITFSAEQTGSWEGSFTLRPPASRSNFTRPEWIERVEAEGGTSLLDGSPTSMEMDVHSRLFPVEERRSNMIALLRSDLEKAYDDGTYIFRHD